MTERVTLGAAQSKLIREAVSAGVVQHEAEAVEIGLAAVRSLLDQHREKLAAAAQAEAEEIARRQYSLF